MKLDVSEKVIVVTGGAGVLGGTFARKLAAEGAKVAILDIDVEKGQEIVNEIEASGGQALALECDVLQKEMVKEAREQIKNKFGVCDILINGAGGNHPSGTTSKETFSLKDLESDDSNLMTFFDLEKEGFEFVFNLNIMGTLIPTQIFARDMVQKDSSTIINISSMAAFSPMTKVPAYAAAKAGISNFTEFLAVHLAEEGIRVNALAPGFFLTEQNRELLTEEDGSPTPRCKKIISQTPMRRLGDPEELLGTLLWLCDEEASGFVTGVVVPVDGGFMSYSGV